MRHIQVLLSLFLFGLLAACASPTPEEGTPGVHAGAQEASSTERSGTRNAGAPDVRPIPAEDTRTQSPSAPGQKRMRTGGPLPPERKADSDGPTMEVDYACRTDADCAVKNVGNCCGYYPACVNKDSPTDPEGVMAQCDTTGMASVCGFPEIAACTCQRGRCEAKVAEALR